MFSAEEQVKRSFSNEDLSGFTTGNDFFGPCGAICRSIESKA
jgi:hypothetical protein